MFGRALLREPLSPLVFFSTTSDCKQCWTLLRQALLALWLVGTGPVLAQSSGEQVGGNARMPTPADLLTHAHPQELALSPDGDTVLLRFRRGNVQDNEYVSQIRLLPTAPEGTTATLDVSAQAHGFEWMPDGDHLAYLAPAEEGEQVWIESIGADSARQVTHRPGGVESFSVSPSGNRLAFLTRTRLARPDTKADSNQIEGIGEEIDMRTFMYLELRGDRLTADPPPPSGQQLWTTGLNGQGAAKVVDTLSVDEYQWSPSGDRLALVATPTRLRAQNPRMPTFRTDLYVYDRDAKRLRTVHTGSLGEETVFDQAVSHSSPFWGPSGERLGFLRTDHSDRFAAVAELGIRDLDAQTTRFVTSADQVELYNPAFHWRRPGKLLVEYTRQARRGLFRLSLDDGTAVPVWNPVEHASGFSFSADGDQAAWVQQSIGTPPEVYTARRPFASPRRISRLNQTLREQVWLPDAESVEWTSRDGTDIQGWFVRPRSELESSVPPLLVFLHGGPGMPSTNRYHPYDGGWLYPIQVFAARGYAVFLPNYRQTGSFGKDFQQVEAPDEEAVADVLTGINHLTTHGWVDSSRIGIMGHSHGAWLGPMVAAERQTTEAASFAEGASNYLSLYSQWSGWRNRGLHEYSLGGSPYERPQRYVSLSPPFQDRFTKNVPTLLEYGQRGTAIQGLETAKALWRHGTPHEFVVYPGVGHSIRKLSVHLESMKRNLQWFEQQMPVEAASATEE